MRILYDFQIFQIQRWGGISRYFFELFKRISMVPEFRPHIFLGLNQIGLPWEETGNPSSIKWDMRIPAKFCRLKTTSALNYVMFSGYQVLSPPFDVLHLTYYPRRIINPNKAKLIVSLYDMIPERFPTLYGDDPILERRRIAFETADLILSISQASLDDLLTIYSIDPARTAVVHLASSFEADVRNPNLKENSELGPPRRPFLLFVGSRESYKNFILVLSIYAKDDEISRDFDLICFGSSPFSPDERRLIEEYRLTGKVIHVSGNDESLRWYYRNASLLVYPSLCEGFGLPLVEAMTLGCPVTASARGSIPEVLGDAGIMFDPDVPESVSKALRDVLFDDRLRDNLISRGHSRATLFSWQRTVEATCTAYKHLWA
jgi:glycosyltransferase involved in cell wall biosynthesis